MSQENISSTSSRRKKKKKKKSVWPKVLLSILFVILFLLSSALGYFYYTIGKIDNVSLNKDNLGITSKEELKDYNDYKKIKNIALLGIDAEDGVGRSDSIMIATIDPAHDKLKITSLMRDSYVNIDGHGYDKLNHAYAYGGAESSIRTINQTFGLNIEDFVAVDFESLPKIINLLGGLDLDITEEEIKYINFYIRELNTDGGSNSPEITSAGPQFVDGIQALAYTRIRYTSGGDFERTHRQRIVLNKIFEKALSIPSSQYITLINETLPLLKTSLSANDFLALGTKVATMGGGKLEQERFPRDGFCQSEMINGVSYITFDEAATKNQMMNYIYDDKK